MNCTNCGAPVKEGNKFCTVCGTPVPLIQPEFIPQDQPPVSAEAPAAEEQPIPFVTESPAEEAPAAAPAAEEPVQAQPEPEAPAVEPEMPAAEPEAPAALEAEPVSAPEYVAVPPVSGPVVPPQPEPAAPYQAAPYQAEPAAPYQPQPVNAPNVPPQGQPYQGQPFQGQGAPYQPQNRPGQFNAYPPQQPQQPKEKKKLSKGALIGIIAGAVALIAAIVLLVIFLSPKEPDPITINLNDYVIAEFEGYSHAGSVKSYDIDRDKLLADHGEAIQYTKAARKEIRNTVRAMTAAEFFETNVLYNVYLTNSDWSSSLANGDTVTFDWEDIGLSQLKWTNVTLEYSPAKVTVSGLTEPDEFDPFEALEVTFTGENGKGSMEVKKPDDDIYSSLWFTYEGRDTLSNGDSVVLTVDLDDWDIRYLVETYHKYPTVTSKTYTVEGLIEAQLFDPFESIEIKFTGFSGYGQAEVVIKDDANPAAASLDYTVSPRIFLEEGDEVTVEFYWSDYRRSEMVLEYGVEPSATSKTYTVTGLDHYITTYEELPQEVSDQMNQQIIDLMLEKLADMNASIGNESAYLHASMELVDARLYTNNEKAGNRIYYIHKVTLTGANGFSTEYYHASYYNNVATDGGVVSISSDCHTDDFYTVSTSTREQVEVQYNDGIGYIHTFQMYGNKTMEEQENVLADALSGYTLVPRP